MKYLKIFENFEDNSEIDKICKNDFNIKNFIINDNKSVTALTDVKLVHLRNFNKLPIKFDKALSNFNCSYHKLETLENCPEKVNKDFDCSHNNLTTLIGGPKYVRESYFCFFNNLKDLYGFPENNPTCVFSYNNPVYEIINLASVDNSLSYKNINKFIHLLNEEKVIRNQDTIIQDRLEVALEYVGIKNIRYETFRYYKLI